MGTFSKSLVRRLSGHPPRPVKPFGLPNNEGQIALHDGRKLWVQRVLRTDWHLLPAGADLLLIRACNQAKPWQQVVEMATVLKNELAHPIGPHLVLAWGWLPEGEPDRRTTTLLMRQEIHVLVRHEVRKTDCPDLVAAIIPSLN